MELIIVLYRPVSTAPANEFFDDLSDVFGHTSTYACPIMLLADINLHLDIAGNWHTVKWQSVLDSYGLVQHVTSSTHRADHALDVIVTRPDCPVTDLQVDPPTISDHSFITIIADLQLRHSWAAITIRRRRWRNLDYDKFSDDLCQSELLLNPPTDAASLVACYNNTMPTTLDKHAPFVNVKPRADVNAPWYDQSMPRSESSHTTSRKSLSTRQERHQPWSMAPPVQITTSDIEDTPNTGQKQLQPKSTIPKRCVWRSTCCSRHPSQLRP